jgi:hypothetical protein
MRGRAPALFCLLAGGGDAATGLLLVTSPDQVLRLLGIPQPADDALLRFVGVFVACVGLAYLYPWLAGGRRLETAIEITAGFRLAVALFLVAAVLRGAMDRPWLTVGAYDATVAVAQLGLLARGFFRHAA